jgi:glutamate N-acetyltransferase/amino-acid N-acetyltransferase
VDAVTWKHKILIRFGKSEYMQKAAEAKYLSGMDQVNVYLKIGDGTGYGKAWGCDLSYEYVRINAEYTT